MPVTLAHLLRDSDLGLKLLTPPTSDQNAPLTWAHSSDLPDPTPFLTAGQILLVTSTPEEVEPYVSRLLGHGVAALGFGAKVRQDTPEALIEACTRLGLPLFDVPYRTPFIAVARFVADRLAADTYARSTWALRASRAISLAALRPDPLGAVIAELARQIERPVVLIGATGEVARSSPSRTLSKSVEQALGDEARTLLAKRRRAAGTTQTDAGPFALQTLGAADRLRGVLAIGSEGLDPAAQQVITGVVALAGLALEQGTAIDASRAQLRTGVWRALLAGDATLAAAVAAPVLGALPEGPVRVTLLTGASLDAATQRWEDHDPGFFARDGDRLLLLETDDANDARDAAVRDLAERFDLRGGVSSRAELSELATALAQAQTAAGRASESERVQRFDDTAAGGMFALLQTPDARAVALSALAPLTAADPGLPDVLRTWLDANGVYDVAARRLGMHRHTLRSRVADAERLLGRDLSSFAACADLYAALRTARMDS